jgi:hypothetical protein
MALNFAALREATTPVSALGYGEEARAQRHATFERVMDLGVHEKVISRMCLITIEAVKHWSRKGGSPQNYLGRRAFDRLGPVVQHMENDLGLTEDAIATFLNEEPRHLEGPDAGDHDARFHNTLITRLGIVPDMGFYYPYFDNPKIEDGLSAVQQRLDLRFAEHPIHAEAVAAPNN